MEMIPSFCVDHDTLNVGLYISRIDKDIVTFDLRMVKPNAGKYLDNDGLHTFEHLFATYVRNSPFQNDVIYVGPMGCRTGFYFIVRKHVDKQQVIALLKSTMQFIMMYEGFIPGSESSSECGNYKEHNLDKARRYAKAYYEVIANYQVEQLNYV